MSLALRKGLLRLTLGALWVTALAGLLSGRWGLLGTLIGVPVLASLIWAGQTAFLGNFFAALGLLALSSLGRALFAPDEHLAQALGALIALAVSSWAAWKFLRADLDRRHSERRTLEALESEKVGLEQGLEAKLKALALNDNRRKRYSRLHEAATLFASTLDLEALGNLLLSQAGQMLSGRKIDLSLWVFDGEGKVLLALRQEQGGGSAALLGEQAKDDPLNQWVLGRGAALSIRDLEKDFRFKGLDLRSMPGRCFYISPLVNAQGVVTGLMRVESSERELVDNEDQRLLESLVVLGSLAIENAKLYRETQELAVTDGLTKLYLRRPLLERLDSEMARALTGGSPFSLLMLDIDHFKSVNDTYGHPAGDRVLREVAALIQSSVRDVDMCGRYGGEEFMVLLPETPREGARIVAERIREAVREQPFELRGEPRQVTVSVGIASLPGDADNARALIDRADEALYRSKEAGRDRVTAWDSSLGGKP